MLEILLKSVEMLPLTVGYRNSWFSILVKHCRGSCFERRRTVSLHSRLQVPWKTRRNLANRQSMSLTTELSQRIY